MVITRRQSAASNIAPTSPSSSTTSTPRKKPRRPRSTTSTTTESATTTDHDHDDIQTETSQPVSAVDAVETDAMKSTQEPPQPQKKKKSDFLLRAVSGLFLTAVFMAVIQGGHMWVGIAVIVMEFGMYNEVLRLGFTVARGGRIPLWRTTGWYFFVSLLFLLYGKIVLTHFHNQDLWIASTPLYQSILQHHSFIAFCMYCAGFVGFVLSLKPNNYHFQFTYFGRSLVALLLVVMQSHFMILNTYLGLIWFILPCWLIIVNDSFGYFCGRLFGKHSLTALSPKKTWEGYIGAGIFTMITAYFLSDYLSTYPSLTCPRLHFNDCVLFCPPLTCQPLPIPFLKHTTTITLPLSIAQFNITYKPVQLHAVALGAFAAIIAPFGGFFASGAKRAFGVKDFGGILPGHGGVTDRVDCQLMMAVFTYAYVINFVNVELTSSPDVSRVLSLAHQLTDDENIDLLYHLFTRLQSRGVDGTSLLVNLTNLTAT